jgi:Glutamine cyclotransferase
MGPGRRCPRLYSDEIDRLPSVRLRLLGIGIAASAVGACDGCSHVPEPEPSAPAAHQATVDTTPAGAVVPRVLGQTPHDPTAFTQGLLFADGVLLESTGGYGASTLRRVDLATGKVLRSIPLAKDVFGEGLARLKGELFQLTWQEHRCFVYDETTFEPRREMTYDGEGGVSRTSGTRGSLLASTLALAKSLATSTSPVRPSRTMTTWRPFSTVSLTTRRATACSSLASYGARCSRWRGQDGRSFST